VGAHQRLPDPLSVYEKLGFLVGDERFAAIGRFVFLPGPADSTLAVLAISLPNSALRFRREPPGFVARYAVVILVGDSTAPTARLSDTKEVRVRTFRETSRRSESVIFQGFVKLLPGVYDAAVSVRDLASPAGFRMEANISVPRFGPYSVAAPIVAYRAQPRLSRQALPSLIISPSATAALGGRDQGLLVYVESLADSADTAVLEWSHDGQVILVDTLALDAGGNHLRTATAALDVTRFPPGRLSLRARVGGSPPSDTSTMVVALQAEWLARDYQEALSLLRYAGTPAQLDELRKAEPGERARRLQLFLKRRDPNPETPENEFFQQYFRRLRDANDRFAETRLGGWLTDRGEVYITLGPPDAVTRDLDVREGPERRQVWIYRESLGFELRLVFLDQTGSGAFSLSAESRQAFRDAVQRLYT
jgi:GWxTD domain-containing protein